MLVNDMLSTTAFVTPYQIYITKTVSVKHSKQVTALVFYQEIKGFFQSTPELVVDITKHTLAYRLRVCVLLYKVAMLIILRLVLITVKRDLMPISQKFLQSLVSLCLRQCQILTVKLPADQLTHKQGIFIMECHAAVFMLFTKYSSWIFRAKFRQSTIFLNRGACCISFILFRLLRWYRNISFSFLLQPCNIILQRLFLTKQLRTLIRCKLRYILVQVRKHLLSLLQCRAALIQAHKRIVIRLHLLVIMSVVIFVIHIRMVSLVHIALAVLLHICQ